MSATYTLSDGVEVHAGAIVELVDGPMSMLLFGDRVTLHRLEVREPDDTFPPDYVPVWHHPFMLSFPADRLRHVETAICDDCDRLIPTDEGEDSPWHDEEVHDSMCAQCGDCVQMLSSRGWCDGCEEEAPTSADRAALPVAGQVVRLALDWRRGELATVQAVEPGGDLPVCVRCSSDGTVLWIESWEVEFLPPVEEIAAVVEVGENDPTVGWREIVNQIKEVLSR